MKIPHKKRSFFLPSMFIIALALCAICFISHYSGTSTILSKGLSVITTPLSSGARYTSDFFESIGTYFYNVKALKNENKRLKEQNELLTEQNESMALLEKENKSLYEFLDLKKEHTDFKLVNAKVIAKTNSNYVSTFIIDKGSFHGIKENMAIITSNGALMGVTYSVDSNSTRCLSVISYDAKVGVYDEECGETGVLSGSFTHFNNNMCVIEGVDELSAIKKGDKIYTSGLGEIYPRGLKIGVVKELVPVKGSHTKDAVVEIDKAVFNSDNVMVITDFEQVYQ